MRFTFSALLTSLKSSILSLDLFQKMTATQKHYMRWFWTVTKTMAKSKILTGWDVVPSPAKPVLAAHTSAAAAASPPSNPAAPAPSFHRKLIINLYIYTHTLYFHTLRLYHKYQCSIYIQYSIIFKLTDESKATDPACSWCKMHRWVPRVQLWDRAILCLRDRAVLCVCGFCVCVSFVISANQMKCTTHDDEALPLRTRN